MSWSACAQVVGTPPPLDDELLDDELELLDDALLLDDELPLDDEALVEELVLALVDPLEPLDPPLDALLELDEVLGLPTPPLDELLSAPPCPALDELPEKRPGGPPPSPPSPFDELAPEPAEQAATRGMETKKEKVCNLRMGRADHIECA